MDELKVFTGNTHPQLAKEVSEYLGIPLGKSDVFKFSNDNTFVRILETCASAMFSLYNRYPSPLTTA